MRYQRILAAAASVMTALLLNACTLTPRPETPGPNGAAQTPPPERALRSEAVTELFRYYRGLDGLADDAIEKERRRNVAALLDGRCDASRLQLAMTLLRVKPRADTAENFDQLLQPCLIAPELAGSDVQTLAVMLQSQLALATLMHQRYRSVVQELESKRQENAELKRQLDGIKAIERSLQDRDRNRRQTEGTHGTAR